MKQPRPKLFLEFFMQQTAEQEDSLSSLIDYVQFFGSADSGISYGPYKQVVTVKFMNNYTKNKPYDPHGFKEQAKIKYKATMAVAGNPQME